MRVQVREQWGRWEQLCLLAYEAGSRSVEVPPEIRQRPPMTEAERRLVYHYIEEQNAYLVQDSNMVPCRVIVGEGLQVAFLLSQCKLEFTEYLCSCDLTRVCVAARGLLVVLMVTAKGISSAHLSPDTGFDDSLNLCPKELTASRRPCAPREEHLLHLVSHQGIDLPISLKEKLGNERAEMARIGLEDVLGDGVENVEGGKFHPGRGLQTYQKGRY